jgi:hypothetical protein
MKKLCLFAIIAFLTFPVFSQSQKGIVFLKNGSEVKGKFTFSNNLEKLKVESAGSIWVFNANEVDSVSYSKKDRADFNVDKENESAVFFRTEMGLLIGNSENSQSAPFSLSSSLNYKLTPKISIGGGLGVEFLKETYMPVFFNAEYKLRDSYSSPYFFVKVGYQVSIEESKEMYYPGYDYQPWSSFAPWPRPDSEHLDAKGGLLINPGIGYQRMFSSGFGMCFAFGYQFHRLEFSGEDDYSLNIDYNRLTLKVGILF